MQYTASLLQKEGELRSQNSKLKQLIQKQSLLNSNYADNNPHGSIEDVKRIKAHYNDLLIKLEAYPEVDKYLRKIRYDELLYNIAQNEDYCGDVDSTNLNNAEIMMNSRKMFTDYAYSSNIKILLPKIYPF